MSEERFTMKVNWEPVQYRPWYGLVRITTMPLTRTEKLRARLSDLSFSALGILAPTFPIIGWFVSIYLVAPWLTPIILRALGRE